MKTCTRCKSEQPLANFTKDKHRPDGLMAHCKECRLYYSRTPRQKASRRAYKLKKDFNLSVTAFVAMKATHSGVCAICLRPETVIDRRTGLLRELCVDHDHSTGEVRGLLCLGCNIALGNFEDNAVFLENAISYLSRSKLRAVA